MCLRTSSTRSWEACSKSCCFAAQQKACIQNQKEHINSIKITHNQNRFHGLAAGKQSQTSRDQGPRKCVLARQKLRFPIDEHRTDIKELINASRCSPPTTFIKNTGENTKSKPFKKTIIFRLYDNISVYTINIPSIRQYFRRLGVIVYLTSSDHSTRRPSIPSAGGPMTEVMNLSIVFLDFGVQATSSSTAPRANSPPSCFSIRMTEEQAELSRCISRERAMKNENIDLHLFARSRRRRSRRICARANGRIGLKLPKGVIHR